MCLCLGDFIVKYVLIIANILFSIAGLAILGLGIAAHIQLNQISDVFPVNLSLLSIGIIVLGSIVFFIAYLACCGALRQSTCMLITYAVFMAILAAIKIYLTVILFRFLNDAQATVSGWIYTAFDNINVRPAFSVMETLFRCCGTYGPGSYNNATVPASCCTTATNGVCLPGDSFDGCAGIVESWFESFGSAIGGVLIGVIVVELVCMLFGLHMSNTIRNNRRRTIS